LLAIIYRTQKRLRRLLAYDHVLNVAVFAVTIVQILVLCGLGKSICYVGIRDPGQLLLVEILAGTEHSDVSVDVLVS
jgi:hypothetical protein